MIIDVYIDESEIGVELVSLKNIFKQRFSTNLYDLY